MKKISICIPAYNEAENLPIAVGEIEKLFQGELSRYEHEIIVTDNASDDATWKVAQELAAKNPKIRAYRFARNFGYQNSIFAGISLATGDAVVEMDADLEDPPGVIPLFVKKWEEGFDVAYGVRGKRHAPWFMKVFFRIFYWLLNKVSDLEIPGNSGDFRLLDRRVVEVLKLLPERNLYLRGLVSFIGFRQAPVVYDRDPRRAGKSKFRFFHYVVLAIDALTAFSKTPLRLIGAAGAGLFVLASLVACYYLWQRVQVGTPVPGFTTLVVLMLFLHSVTFMFLGLLGEYLSRIFDDSKGRPRVIIADAVNARDYPKVL